MNKIARNNGGNNTILVTGTNDVEVNGVNTEVYKTRTITISGNVVETITGTRELTIGNTNKETYKGKEL